MDLKQLRPTERMVEIMHPGTGEPLGVRVGLLHLADERLKKLKHSFQNERYRLEARGKSFKAENFEDNANELSFAAMTCWEWYNPTGKEGDEGFKPDAHPSFNGDTNPQFTKKNVFDIFETLPWFRDQLGVEMGDDKAFFQG